MATDRSPVLAYVDPEVKKKLEERAKEEERSVSYIVRRLLTEATKDW